MQKAYNSGIVIFMAFVMSLVASLSIARAQDEPGHGIMTNGDAAVTGFSGTSDQNGQPFINTEGTSVKIIGLSDAENPRGQVIQPPVKLETPARSVGQVFGVALDNATPPNIYVTATSSYGLSIVTPDTNGDGIPEKATTGAADATFMAGQFGPEGGAGSIWKIDGTTGAVSQFANIENSVAGLGNISFDATHYQFFVSDLESGLVHRIGMNGQIIDTFDHGATGRPVAGLEAVNDDPSLKADITNPDFDTENADTWGLTDVRRRVWGLSFYRNRLYYSPTEGPQVWSVGIKQDGSFADDARVEIQTVPGGFPVSDMLFTSNGKMILAQRGGHFGSTDYSQFHTPGNNAVLRYGRDETGKWIQEPKEYAIGFPPDHKNASGGVGLACGNVIWSTGDALRNDPALADRLSQGGELVINGLQGSRYSAVRPLNTPPFSSWFVDYDGQFNDPQNIGHVGDVEIYRDCQRRTDGYFEERWPGWTPEWIPPGGWYPPEWWPEYPDLRLIKRNTRCKYVGKSLIVECKFKMIVTNVGAVVYTGPLNIVDNVPANVTYVPPPAGNIAWNCQQPGGSGAPIVCNSVNIETLFPGHSKTLILKMRYTGGKHRRRIKNCAILEVPDEYLANNEDCGFGKVPRPVRKYCPKGWTRYPTTGSVPNGWQIQTIGKLICAKPRRIVVPPLPLPLPGPVCRRNEDRFFNPADIPPRWRSRRVTRNGRTVWCAKPPIIVDPVPLPGPVCRRGERRYFNPNDIPPRWRSRRMTRNGRTVWCAKPALALEQCRRGETLFTSRQAIPRGWKRRVIFQNRRRVWCARPGIVTPVRICAKGERRFANQSQVPRGWKWRQVRRNGVTYICAKRQFVICKPGTHRVGKRCVPDRVQIICRKGTHRVGKRCVPNRVQIICRKGTHRVGKRCVKDTIIIKPRPVAPRLIPGLIRCPVGTRRVNGRCVKN